MKSGGGSGAFYWKNEAKAGKQQGLCRSLDKIMKKKKGETLNEK